MNDDAEQRAGALQTGSVYALTATGIAVSRRGSGILACDRNFGDVLERTPAELVGLSMEDLVHPDDIPAHTWLLRGAMAGPRAYDVRTRYLLPNGGVRWVENRISVLTPGPHSLIAVLIRATHPPSQPKASLAMREYLADMCRQLAELAKADGLVTAWEALTLANGLLSE